MLLLGLLSWILVGTAAGLLASRLLPGEPRLGMVLAAITGLIGALAGGLLATALGFGGIAAYDLRSLVTATLGASLACLALRYIKLAA